MMEEEKRGLDLKSPRPFSLSLVVLALCWGGPALWKHFVRSDLCSFKVRAVLSVKTREFGGPGVIEAAFEEEKRLREGSWRALYLWGTVALY